MYQISVRTSDRRVLQLGEVTYGIADLAYSPEDFEPQFRPHDYELRHRPEDFDVRFNPADLDEQGRPREGATATATLREGAEPIPTLKDGVVPTPMLKDGAIPRPAIEVGLGDRAGCEAETVTDQTYGVIVTALGSIQGDGGVTISPDHTEVTIVPPSAEWTAAQATRQAEEDALRAAVAAHPDPVVQMLARRAGLG